MSENASNSFYKVPTRTIPALAGKDIARFVGLITKTESCWNWSNAHGESYGSFSLCGKNYHPNRVAYTLFVGPIPDGLVVDHLCCNRACVNPSHLRVITNAENVVCGRGSAAKNKAKTHCKYGHEYTIENTGFKPWRNYKKTRFCRACNRIQKKKAYDAKKGIR